MRWIWLLALLACGDNVIPRLERVHYDIAGVEVDDPELFHDRLRDEDCTAMKWADGATYCTPQYTDAVYSDPICTHPLAHASDVPAGYVGTYFVLRGDASLRRLWPVAAEITTPAQYWVLESGSCLGPYSGDSNTHYAAVGAELDESHFVRVRRSAPAGSGRVQLVALDTDDGLHVPLALHDRTLSTDCDLEFAQDVDHARCVPAGAVAGTLFRDAGCSEPVLLSPDPPPFARYGASDCPTYATVGDEVTGEQLFDITDGVCGPVTLPNGYRQFAVGAPLDLPVVTRERGAGTRIQPIARVAGAVRIPDGWVHDTQLAADCRPGLLAGTHRCMPATTDVTSYFIDDQCRDPIDVAFIPESACAPAPKFAFRPEAVHPIGERVPMQLYEVSTGDRCVPYAPQPPYVAHMIGPPLPLDTFAPADPRY